MYYYVYYDYDSAKSKRVQVSEHVIGAIEQEAVTEAV